MKVYINGIGLVSPQETIDNQRFLENIVELQAEYFPIIEPPYKDFIDPKELRRMSKIIRNGIVAAKIALAESGMENPDAILTGTGLGCAIDTEKFLTSMIENKESMLTPTSFIQSTHNTLGGSIAIGLGCHNYNMTYVHRGFSFETALIDAMLMIQSGEIANALVGAFDEMTYMHNRLIRSTPMYNPQTGAVPGQATGFFGLDVILSENSYGQLLDVKTLYNPELATIESEIESLLKAHGADASKTVVLMGYNGLEAEKLVYDHIKNKLFTNSAIGHFKQLCGEFYTATGFAFWIAAQILKKQSLPQAIIYSGLIPESIEHVLIYNQFQQIEHSLILLGKC